jgi:DNA-binding transcriptional MerR regulator
VAYKEKPTVKLYYSIGEVAAMFDVNTSLIRFWEKEFDIIKPTKNKKGNRLFTIDDIENFKKIFALVKGEGYTLQGAKEKLREKGFEVFAEPQKHEKAEVIEKLLRMKEELKKIKEKL